VGYFFLLLAGLAGLGLYRIRHSDGKRLKYLEEAQPEPPLQVAHLSSVLARFVEDTRLLRISLESPVRGVREFIDGDFDATAEDVDGFDTMLMNVSRQLADWLLSSERLPESDRARMLDLGADPAKIRNALAREGGAFERRNLRMAGHPRMDTRLQHVLSELVAIETRLQTHERLYR
jgi:hypothetical protein